MGQVNRLNFGAVPDPGNTLTIDLSNITSQDQMPRGFPYKATCYLTSYYYCIHIYYTTGMSHSGEMSCLAEVFALRVLHQL